MKLINLTKKYQGKYLTYYEARYINLDGKYKDYEFISRNSNLTMETFLNHIPAGVGMITFSLDKKKILIQKEFRLACNEWVYNFPAGLIDEDETPEMAATRELKEETGLTIKKIEKVLSPSYASQGTSDEMMTIVICIADGKIENSCYVNEEIEAKWYNKEEVKELFEEKVVKKIASALEESERDEFVRMKVVKKKTLANN